MERILIGQNYRIMDPGNSNGGGLITMPKMLMMQSKYLKIGAKMDIFFDRDNQEVIYKIVDVENEKE